MSAEASRGVPSILDYDAQDPTLCDDLTPQTAEDFETTLAEFDGFARHDTIRSVELAFQRPNSPYGLKVSVTHNETARKEDDHDTQLAISIPDEPELVVAAYPVTGPGDPYHGGDFDLIRGIMRQRVMQFIGGVASAEMLWLSSAWQQLIERDDPSFVRYLIGELIETSPRSVDTFTRATLADAVPDDTWVQYEQMTRKNGCTPAQDPLRTLLSLDIYSGGRQAGYYLEPMHGIEKLTLDVQDYFMPADSDELERILEQVDEQEEVIGLDGLPLDQSTIGANAQYIQDGDVGILKVTEGKLRVVTRALQHVNGQLGAAQKRWPRPL